MKLTIEHYKNKSLLPLDNEIFKEHPINTQYLISNLGRILSKKQVVIHNYGGSATRKEKIMTQSISNNYLCVGLTINGKTKTTKVHRLVAETFIKKTGENLCVNHINGIKTDNRVENLEWLTQKENVKHAWDNGLAKKQSSFIYLQNILKQINGYIANRPRVITPIGLGTIIIDQNCYRIEYDNGKYENLIKSLRVHKDDFKLVLYNLSDLTKFCEDLGFVPIEELQKRDSDIEFLGWYQSTYAFRLDGKAVGILAMPYYIIDQLIKWHFAVNIPEELYIDINTLFMSKNKIKVCSKCKKIKGKGNTQMQGCKCETKK